MDGSPTPPDDPGKVRTTVDLTLDEHRALRDWCNKTADEMGVPRVAARQVLRELLAELRSDKNLQQRIRERLKAVTR